MAVGVDRILGKAFFNDEVMEKLIQQLFHFSFLIPLPFPSLPTNQPPAYQQADGSDRGEWRPVLERGRKRG
jgi:hypothetical protein